MAAILTRRLAPPEHAGPLRDLIEATARDGPGRPPGRAVGRDRPRRAGGRNRERPGPGTARADQPAGRPEPAVRGHPAAIRRQASGAAAPCPVVTRVAAAVRANPRLAVGLVTAVAMVLVLILVTLIFPREAQAGTAVPGQSRELAKRDGHADRDHLGKRLTRSGHCGTRQKPAPPAVEPRMVPATAAWYERIKPHVAVTRGGP